MQRTWRAGSPDSQFARWLMIVSIAIAGLPVADDQLALATADRRHRVDGLDARLQRLFHRLTLHHGRCLQLKRAQLGVLDRTVTIEGLAQRTDHPAEEAVAYRNRQDLAGPLDPLALLDLAEVAENDHADLADVQVQRQAAGAVLELEQLVRHRRRQSLNPGDAITALGDGADLFGGGGARLVCLDETRQGVPDLLGPDSQLRHLPRVSLVWSLLIDDLGISGRPVMRPGPGAARPGG